MKLKQLNLISIICLIPASYFTFQIITLLIHPVRTTWLIGREAQLQPLYMLDLEINIFVLVGLIFLTFSPFYISSVRLLLVNPVIIQFAKVCFLVSIAACNLAFAFTSELSYRVMPILSFFFQPFQYLLTESEKLLEISQLPEISALNFDFTALIYFLIALFSVFVLSKSFTRMLQLGSLLLATLGAEVFFFFPSDWDVFSTNLQNVEHFLPSVTNEVLFFGSIVILSITTLGRLFVMKKF